VTQSAIKPRAMRDVFIERIWQSMAADESVFFLSADFGSPMLDRIRADFPSRFVNVGIAEQNLINVAVGLALEGFSVNAYAIAPFITMRCFEQIRVSLALLSTVRPMKVNLIGVGAGYSYVVSGPTHQCYEDISLMRTLPTVRVLSPADHVSAAALFDLTRSVGGINYLRFDAQPLPVLYQEAPASFSSGLIVHSRGTDATFVSTGYMTHVALDVAAALATRGFSIGIVDLIDLSRFDKTLLLTELVQSNAIVSLEEGFSGKGGLDSALLSLLSTEGLQKSFLSIGVPGSYRFELGARDVLHEQVGIGRNAVTRRVLDFLDQR